MKTIIYILLSFSILLTISVNNSFSQSCENKKTTHIYFGNGVMNTLAQANQSRLALQTAYLHDSRLAYPNETFRFFLSYNPSRGFMRDLTEVVNQKVEETGGLTVSQLINLMKLSREAAEIVIKNMSTASGGGRIVVEVALQALDMVTDIYLERLENDAEGVAIYYENEIEENFIQKYYSDLNEGNLFANNSVQGVVNRKYELQNNIKIIGVANPAGETIYGNQYITGKDDVVINTLRVLGYTVLPWNIDNDPGVFAQSWFYGIIFSIRITY